MPPEKSAGVLVFRDRKLPLFLLLHYEEGHWDFPKGHLEKGEGLKEAALRELKEETGISDVKLLPGFRKTIRYFYKLKDGRTSLKFVTFFLAKTKKTNAKVRLSSEHVGYTWLPYEKAVEKLTYKTARGVLAEGNKFLKTRQKAKGKGQGSG